MAATAPASAESLMVFLVRHAEKADTSRDPELSAAGRKRAEVLAHVLKDAEVGHVHVTGYKRTHATAAPIAAQAGVEAKEYKPADLVGFVSGMRSAGGRHLVVGHTNTLPKTIELLGGDPGFPIDEAAEFDRLYVVTIAADGKASTVLLRYGARSD